MMQQRPAVMTPEMVAQLLAQQQLRQRIAAQLMAQQQARAQAQAELMAQPLQMIQQSQAQRQQEDETRRRALLEGDRDGIV